MMDNAVTPKRRTVVLLCGTALLQFLILVGELGMSLYPRLIGTEVLLSMAPVDPRDIFRGNYARLRYDIGAISYSLLDVPEPPDGFRQGEILYVTLERDGETWQATGASLSRPASGTFIRGRVSRAGSWWGSGNGIPMNYGIEAFFASKNKAMELEGALVGVSRPLARARVMIAPDGKASLVGVITSRGKY